MPAELPPDAALAALADRLQPLASESIPLDEAAGRILADDLHADRDSPAADVSAMDGYALRASDLEGTEPLSVSGESVPGHAPPEAVPGAVVRIFTGGVVPPGFDLVVRREDTDETGDRVRLLPPPRPHAAGQNIRRRGENAPAGSTVARRGGLLHAGSIAAAANFGASRVTVARRVRVAILVTGDELQEVDAQVQPWQLRDSNGATLAGLLALCPWIDPFPAARVADSPDALDEALAAALDTADAVVLTGGVSMGDYDYVPDAVRRCGGSVVFHRLPIRPGKPILGAATGDGRPLVGLPGNPVSAAIGCRRFVLPLLGRLAGLPQLDAPRPTLRLDEAGDRQLPLHWYRLVTRSAAGAARPVSTRGSGDLVALAASDGFTEQPPHTAGSGPWPYWSWTDIVP